MGTAENPTDPLGPSLADGVDALVDVVAATVAALGGDLSIGVGIAADTDVQVIPCSVVTEQAGRSARATDTWLRLRCAVRIRDDHPPALDVLASLQSWASQHSGLAEATDDPIGWHPGWVHLALDVPHRARRAPLVSVRVREPLVLQLSPTTTRAGRITGNGFPLVGARIGAGDHGPQTHSDADGRFVLTGVGTGDHLWADVKGQRYGPGSTEHDGSIINLHEGEAE